jgi:hypothetical protein
MAHSGLPVALRREWLRAAALVWGTVVLLGHVTTYHEFLGGAELPPDLVQHLTGIGLFTLLYRLSWARVEGPGHASWLGPGAASLLVCCGWCGLCECLQLLIPLRDFDLRELALNTITPAGIIGAWWLVSQVWE